MKTKLNWRFLIFAGALTALLLYSTVLAKNGIIAFCEPQPESRTTCSVTGGETLFDQIVCPTDPQTQIICKMESDTVYDFGNGWKGCIAASDQGSRYTPHFGGNDDCENVFSELERKTWYRSGYASYSKMSFSPSESVFISCDGATDNICKLSTGRVYCANDCSKGGGTMLPKKYAPAKPINPGDYDRCRPVIKGTYDTYEACKIAYDETLVNPATTTGTGTEITSSPPPSECKKEARKDIGAANPDSLASTEEVTKQDASTVCYSEIVKTSACSAQKFIRKGTIDDPCKADVESIKCSFSKNSKPYKDGEFLRCGVIGKKAIANTGGGSGSSGSGSTGASGDSGGSSNASGGGQNISSTPLQFRDVEGRISNKNTEAAILDIAKLMDLKTFNFNGIYQPKKKTTFAFAVSMALAIQNKDCGGSPTATRCRNAAVKLDVIDKKNAKKTKITIGELYELLLNVAKIPLVDKKTITARDLCKDVSADDDFAQVIATAKKHKIATVYRGKKCKLKQSASRATTAVYGSRILNYLKAQAEENK